MKKLKIFSILLACLSLLALNLVFVSCDELLEPDHTHQWGEWQTTTAPTCTTEGVETRTCALDSSHKETRAAAINPNAHQWGGYITVTPATATTDGVEKRTCSLNASHTEIRTIIAFNHIHQWGDWVVTTPATATTEGVETRTCLINSAHTETRVIPRTGTAPNHTHIWGDWTVTKAATETEDGEESITCTICGEIRESRFSGEYATGSSGLLFQLINGNTEYRVRRDPNAPVTSGEVYIPARHLNSVTGEYLLVTEIGSYN